MARIVRKLPVQVEMALAGQAPTIGLLFLSSRGLNGSGPDTLLGFLNRTGERMIPFERECDGAILLVSRCRIAWIRSLCSKDNDLIHPVHYCVTREELVRVRFVGGTQIEGLIQLELNDTTSRASDFINASGIFFSLLTPSGLCLVNKESLLEIRVFEGSPLPQFPERVNGK